MKQITSSKVGKTLAVLAVSLMATAASAQAGDYYGAQYTPSMSYASASQTFMQNGLSSSLHATQNVGNPYTVMGKTYYPAHNPNYNEVGPVSWYGDRFHGKMTASGEIFDKNAMTAAHRTLPLGSLVTVTNLATGQSLTVRINDRGPFVGNGLIDLSEAAATALGFTAMGGGDVQVKYAGPAAPKQQGYMPRLQQPRQHMQPQFQAQAPAPAQMFMPEVVAPHAPVAIPQSQAQMAQGQTTLTIKGPIHMASHKGTHAPARLIKAVNRVSYATK